MKNQLATYLKYLLESITLDLGGDGTMVGCIAGAKQKFNKHYIVE